MGKPTTLIQVSTELHSLHTLPGDQKGRDRVFTLYHLSGPSICPCFTLCISICRAPAPSPLGNSTACDTCGQSCQSCQSVHPRTPVYGLNPRSKLGLSDSQILKGINPRREKALATVPLLLSPEGKSL